MCQIKHYKLKQECRNGIIREHRLHKRVNNYAIRGFSYIGLSTTSN